LTELKRLRLSLSDVAMGQSSDVEFGKDVLSKLSLLEELRINVNKGFLKKENAMDGFLEKVDFTFNLLSHSGLS
jgi:hypothetical protein